MHVEDSLTRTRAGVEDHAVVLSKTFRLGDKPSRAHQRGKIVALSHGKRGRIGFVSPRNHQHMGRRLWVDVAEGNCVVIFMHYLCREIPRDDLAEKAVSDGHQVLGHGSRIRAHSQ